MYIVKDAMLKRKSLATNNGNSHHEDGLNDDRSFEMPSKRVRETAPITNETNDVNDAQHESLMDAIYISNQIVIESDIETLRPDSNDRSKGFFVDVVKLLDSADVMTSSHYERVLSLSDHTVGYFKSLVEILIKHELLTKDTFPSVIEAFQEVPYILFMFIGFLNKEQILNQDTLSTAVSIDTSKVWWDMERAGGKAGEFTRKFLKQCNFLYKDPIFYQRATQLVFDMFSNSKKAGLRGLGEAFTTLYNANVLSLDVMPLLVTSEERYAVKAEGIIFLHGNNYLEALFQPGITFGKFGTSHFNFLKFLHEKQCLDENILALIFQNNQQKPPLGKLDISNLHDKVKLVAELSQDYLYQVVKSLLEHESIKTCSLPTIIQILLPEFELSQDVWHRLEQESARIYKKSRDVKMDRGLLREIVELWKLILKHDLNTPTIREALIEGQLDRVKLNTTRRDRTSVPIFLTSLLKERSVDVTLLETMLVSPALKSRVSALEDCFLEHARYGIGYDESFYLLKYDLLFNLFTENYLLQADSDLQLFSDLMHICVKLKTSAPEYLDDAQQLQRLIDSQSYRTISTLINFPALSNDLREVFQDVLSHYENFCDENNRLLLQLIRIPPHVLTREHWGRMLQICRNDDLTLANRRVAISRMLVAMVPAAPRRLAPVFQGRVQGINGAQTTHTESVHMGTNITMWLMNINRASLKTEKIKTQTIIFQEKIKKMAKNKERSLIDTYRLGGLIKAMQNPSGLVLQLSVEEKQRCMDFINKKQLFAGDKSRIMDALQQSLSAPLSMSFYQFIMSLYHDILATKPDSIADEDVFEALLRASYECHRGYNLNDKGVDTDLNAPSRSLCLSGSFNKFCEILSPFSDNIFHFFVSDATIMARAKCMFLEGLSNSIDESCRYGRFNEAKQKLNLLQSDDAGEAFESLYDDHNASLSLDIHQEFLHFKSPEKIEAILSGFKLNAVPYFQSPLSDSAANVLTPLFIKWFKTKISSIDNHCIAVQSSSSIFVSTTYSQGECSMEVAAETEEENIENGLSNS